MNSEPLPHPALTPDQWKNLVHAAQDKVRLSELFDQNRDRLKRIVHASMDHRMQSRIDASDVLQETFLEAFVRFQEYLAKPDVSVFVWLRFLAKQRLMTMHRRHITALSRDLRRDVSLQHFEANQGSMAMAAAQLAARITTASGVLARKELRMNVQAALEKVDDKSREILLLRHFEQLSNAESAEVLQVSPTAASNRYIRALERLKMILGADLEIGM